MPRPMTLRFLISRHPRGSPPHCSTYPGWPMSSKSTPTSALPVSMRVSCMAIQCGVCCPPWCIRTRFSMAPLSVALWDVTPPSMPFRIIRWCGRCMPSTDRHYGLAGWCSRWPKPPSRNECARPAWQRGWWRTCWELMARYSARSVAGHRMWIWPKPPRSARPGGENDAHR
jgi:hypothetical protein